MKRTKVDTVDVEVAIKIEEQTIGGNAWPCERFLELRVVMQRNHSVAGYVAGVAIRSQGDEMHRVVQVDPADVLAPNVAAKAIPVDVEAAIDASGRIVFAATSC